MVDYSARRLQTIPLYRYTMFKDSQKLKSLSFNKIINPHWFFPSSSPQTTPFSSLQDLSNLLHIFTRSQLLQILHSAALSSPETLSAILSAARDPSTSLQVFVSGLDLNTTDDHLRDLFSEYGDLNDVKVIRDRQTKQCKGYGFVAFKKPEALITALKHPSKRLNGHVIHARPAAQDAPKYDLDEALERTVFIRNVPKEMESEELVEFFSVYGEIEEGPRGRYDHRKGKYRSYCFLTYKNVEGVRNVVKGEKKKKVGGVWVWCEEAKVRRKKGKEDQVVVYMPPEKAELVAGARDRVFPAAAAMTTLVPYVYLYYYYYYYLGVGMDGGINSVF